MSSVGAAELLSRLGREEDLEPGSEAVHLRRLEVETDLDRLGDAVEALASLPCTGEVERELRKEKAKRALEKNSARPSSVAGLVSAAFKGGPSAAGNESNAPGRPLSWEVVEPWEDPVTGEDVAGHLEETLRRYVVLPEGGPEAVTLWALNTYLFDSFNVCPILAFTSPEKECGKTTARNVLGGLVRRGWKCTASISPSAIFRAIEGDRDDPPTILIDEVDNLFTRRGGHTETEVKTLLNSGYTRDEQAVRNALVGNNYEPREFSTWTPKALFLIDRGGLPDTIRSRSIEVPMRRLSPGETVEDFGIGEIQAQLLPLRRKAARWAEDHRASLPSLTRAVSLPAGLKGRVADNWRPLLAIAEALGGPWPEKARSAWKALSALGKIEGEEDSIGVQLLADIRKIFDSGKWKGRDRIFTRDLLSELHSMEERSWGDWKRGNSIDASQVAALLKPFTPRVKSRSIWIEDDSAKGYLREDFEPLWASYLSAAESVSGSLDPSESRQSRQGRQNANSAGSRGTRGNDRQASEEASEETPNGSESEPPGDHLTTSLTDHLTPTRAGERPMHKEADGLTPLTDPLDSSGDLEPSTEAEPCLRALSGECDGSCDGKCWLY